MVTVTQKICKWKPKTEIQESTQMLTPYNGVTATAAPPQTGTQSDRSDNDD